MSTHTFYLPDATSLVYETKPSMAILWQNTGKSLVAVSYGPRDSQAVRSMLRAMLMEGLKKPQ